MISKFLSEIRNKGNRSPGSMSTKPGRYERKFVIDRLNSKQLESIIKHHPAVFKEVYKVRQVNNIYLDTIDLKTYYDNVYGNTNRIKVRIRWYGETFGEIEKPVLELKIKSGLAGKKELFPLTSFSMDKDFTMDRLKQVFHQSELPVWLQEKLAAYFPSLLNSYSRKYFASHDKKLRITLDTDMKYYGISNRNNNFLKSYQEKQRVIFEMKYELDSAFVASDICQHFPMRMTKSSKYVTGIGLINPLMAD